MKSRNTLFSIVVFLAILLTACGGASTPDTMMEEKESMTEEPMMEESHEDAMAEPTQEAMINDTK